MNSRDAAIQLFASPVLVKDYKTINAINIKLYEIANNGAKGNTQYFVKAKAAELTHDNTVWTWTPGKAAEAGTVKTAGFDYGVDTCATTLAIAEERLAKTDPTDATAVKAAEEAIQIAKGNYQIALLRDVQSAFRWYVMQDTSHVDEAAGTAWYKEFKAARAKAAAEAAEAAVKAAAETARKTLIERINLPAAEAAEAEAIKALVLASTSGDKSDLAKAAAAVKAAAEAVKAARAKAARIAALGNREACAAMKLANAAAEAAEAEAKAAMKGAAVKAA